MTSAHPAARPMARGLSTFWTQTAEALCGTLECGTTGLDAAEADRRLGRYGLNTDVQAKNVSLFGSVARRVLEPLSLMLLAAGIVSIVTGDAIGGSIIMAILVLSISLDTLQEGQAAKAADMLRRSVALKAEVKRDGSFADIDVEDVVPGDVLRVKSGDIIPADTLLLDSSAFVAGEAALTGEPYPVEKRAATITGKTAGEASNASFRGAVAQAAS